MQFNHDGNKSWSQALYDKLQQLIDQHQLATKYAEMTELINATDDDEFDLIWDEFWDLSCSINLHIESYDPDTTYKDDIISRYNAIAEYMECNDIEQI